MPVLPNNRIKYRKREIEWRRAKDGSDDPDANPLWDSLRNPSAAPLKLRRDHGAEKPPTG